MAKVATSTTPSATTEVGTVRRKTPVRDVVLSPDFLVGMPLGFMLSVLPAAIPALLPNGFTFMISLAAISAGVAALVLTPMTMLLGALTPALKALLSRLPSGAAGTFVPFAQVAAVAAAASFSSLVVAILTPLAPGTFPWVIWLVAGIPMALFLWAVVGCVQVTFFLIRMFNTAQRAEELQARVDSAKASKAARS